MPATETLSSTTLGAPVGPHDTAVKLASTTGVFPGYRLFVNDELMAVESIGVDSWVNVRRGVDGTKGSAHPSSATVWIGQAHQFYDRDPVGRPPSAVLVSPWINVSNGSVWFARGNALPESDANRWWQKQTVTHSEGALGVITTTYDPTVST